MNGAATAQLRSRLCARLEARGGEIEQAILTRVYSIADPTAVGSPEYVTGLRGAVAAAVGYGLAVIEAGRAGAIPIPPELLAQARHAACSGVPLDTVLRRYVAGHTLMGDFVVREAESSRLGAGELQGLARIQAEMFDELVDAVADEYERGLREKAGTIAQRQAETVTRLLAGELVDTGSLGYELDRWHLGILVTGSGVEATIRAQAAALDRRPLLVPRPQGEVWAWLGGSRMPSPEDLRRLLDAPWPTHAHVAIGEPAEGLNGWRLSHHQAAAALPVARCGPRTTVRYSEVALLASTLQDEVLIQSLHHLYLTPLCDGSDGGVALRETLRAYLVAGGNVSSAASAIGVSRKTVTTRLQIAEERLGRSLSSCTAELEVALRLDRLEEGNGSTLGSTSQILTHTEEVMPR